MKMYARCRNTIPPSGTKSPRLCLVVVFLVIRPVQVVVSIVIVNETDLIFVGLRVTGVAPFVSVWPRTTTAVTLFVNWTLQFCVAGFCLQQQTHTSGVHSVLSNKPIRSRSDISSVLVACANADDACRVVSSFTAQSAHLTGQRLALCSLSPQKVQQQFL
jgi:hypothetical protein